MKKERDQGPSQWWRPHGWVLGLVQSTLVALHEWAVAQGYGGLAFGARALLLVITRSRRR